MKRGMWRCALYLFLPIFLVSGSFAQVQNASLTGLVTDSSGAVIEGATVSVKNRATNLVYGQQTDSSGYYLFPSLPIGTYTVTVEMAGFRKSVQDDVLLQTGQRGRNDVRLQVGGVTDEVQVSASISDLETQQSSPSSLVSNRLVLDVPLAIRNWDDLLVGVAGVTG